MKSYVTIQNVEDRNLPLIYQGRRYELTPKGTEGAEIPVTEAVAKAFKDHYEDSVRIVTESELTEYIPEVVQKTTVWLANITGSPDIPKQCVTGYVKKGVDEGKAIFGPNPDAVAHDINVSCQGRGRGQIITKALDGFRNCITTRKKTYRLRPFEIKEFPAAIAEEFLKQQYNKPADLPAVVIRSHDIREMENKLGQQCPRMSWALNDMRYWLMLAHPDGQNPAIHGPSEQEIQERCGDDEDLFPLELHKAKQELWRRCFVVFATPESQCPSKKQLESFISKQLKAEAAAAAKARKAEQQATTQA